MITHQLLFHTSERKALSYLVHDPSVTHTFNMIMHRLLLRLFQPPSLQKLIIDLLWLDPSIPRTALAKDVILPLSLHPVELPQFSRSFYACWPSLVDVDVCDVPVVNVFFYVERDGGIDDGFPREPGDALLERGVRERAGQEQGALGT